MKNSYLYKLRTALDSIISKCCIVIIIPKLTTTTRSPRGLLAPVYFGIQWIVNFVSHLLPKLYYYYCFGLENPHWDPVFLI